MYPYQTRLSITLLAHIYSQLVVFSNVACFYPQFIFVVHPFIIEDTFIHCLNVVAPESFTVCVEFVAICMDFNITWEFDGNQIINDSNHVIVNSDLGVSRYKTCIEVLQSSERDAGTYTVTVAAATGSDSADIIIKIISKELNTNL